MEVQLDRQVRGVRFLTGREAEARRNIITTLVGMAKAWSFNEVVLPYVELAETYREKSNSEFAGQLCAFTDKKGKKLCLRPEGTAAIRLLARGPLKYHKDVKVWYETRCWREVKGHGGGLRESTQFGVELLWPKDPKGMKEYVLSMARGMVGLFSAEFETGVAAKRSDSEFEITVPSLGADKSVCNGRVHTEGIGFALEVDRLMHLVK